VSLGTHRSLAELFLARVEQAPDKRAFSVPAPESYLELTWEQTRRRAFAIAGALVAAGLERGECCAILSSTRIEWILTDFGILCAGGATATLYPASTPDDCAYILENSAARWIFVEDLAQLEKLAPLRAKLSSLVQVVVFEGECPDPDVAVSLAEFEARGEEFNLEHPGRVERIARMLGGDDLATLIYTSGTTGRPKGVELTHDCWLAAGETIEHTQIVSPGDLQYMWLPLSHAFGKLLVAAQLAIGFESAIDGRIPHMMDNLPRVRPTFMAAAPRIFEKIYNRVVATAEHAGALRYAIFRWAVHIGRRISRLRQTGQEPGPFLSLQHRLAERLVFAPLRDRFGGRFRFFVSGSAPLSVEIAEFFHAAGLLIIEGYGLTESSAVGASNTLTRYRFGTVGQVHSTIQARIAEDGELLLKGRPIMRGYRGLPDETAEVLDADGWLHTGDIAEIESDGFVRITDRKKDLIKTSGGKYVAPQKLEGGLKARCPYISQVTIHGNNRNYCSALVTLDPDSIQPWAKERGLEGLSAEQLVARPEVVQLIERAVADLNASLASYETIKRFAILPRDFSVESGELTPSLKIKRRVVEEHYRDILDSFYAGSIRSV